jgi:glycosyltransferase involved in cell wall biosynthesis
VNIGLVSEHASPLAALGGEDAGGQNVHVASLAAALARTGHRVIVYTRRDDPDLADTVPLAEGVTVEHVPAGPPVPLLKDHMAQYMPAFADWLGDRWEQDPPDIVHAHFWMSGFAAIRAARRPGIPVVQTFHALGSIKRRYQASADTSPLQRISTEAAIGRHASAIIATCTDEVRELAGYGVSPSRIYVVPCGVDADLFRANLAAPRHNAADWPGPHSGARVVTLGRLVPRKGVDTAIAAMAHVPGAQLLVAGGPDASQLDQDPEVSRLRAAAATAGVADRISFTGRVRHEDVPALLRSADVVVSDPWYEPFGIVPLEAMACGSAVVASAVGGHLDTVQDGITGLLVPPRDPAALAERIRLLLGRPRLRSALGSAGLSQVRTRYCWDSIAGETEAVYSRVGRPQPAVPGSGARI